MEVVEELYRQHAVYLWLGLVVLVTLLLFWLIYLQVRVSRMMRHYGALTRHVGHGNLEELLNRHLERITDTSLKLEELTAFSQELDGRLQQAIQRVGMVRFNPFDDTGGDQSFAIAMLDAEDNGLVLSSLFSRTGTRIYAKPIHKGRSKYNLSDEELQALRQANAERPSTRLR
ncbi:MAG: DUF4446 family protein [Chloroflexi bacterium]|nr:DUF4446 family protein [Chloroflexota bacterium]MCL5074452.1 DUF4446 family protein [Chloroflexota bacterium]